MAEEVKSGFVAHLIELRDRLIKALLSIFIIFIAIVYFANDIYAFVAQPLVSHLPSTATMIATDVTAPFFCTFQTNFICRFICVNSVDIASNLGVYSAGFISA